MKSRSDRPEPMNPYPQPIASPGEQRREEDVEQEEIDAALAWLRHVEAGRIG